MSKQKTNSQAKSGMLLILIALFIGLVGYVLFNGVSVGVYDIGNVSQNINYGLDLTGGVNVVLEAQATDDEAVTAEKIESAMLTIRQRIDTLGVSEPTITKQGDNRIRVSIPSVSDQEEALDLIGKTAQLEFVGPDGTVILTGKDVVDSKGVMQTDSSGLEKAVVTLKFSEEGTKLFADATQKYIGQAIQIKLDDEIISSPTVNVAITNGEAVIEGIGDIEEAGNLASLIRGGALPVKLVPIEVRTVGPTLGQNSLDKSIYAGMIGIALVLVFMLIFYRGLGIIADLALIIFIIIFMIILTALNVTLTLPGIAGLILTIGMAVDANVIIFERIKEEARLGKSLLTAIDNGFSRAFSTILDSNVTTLIAGFVLFFLGSGSVQGFAVTLILGILVSMFTAVVITKQLVILLVKTELFKSNSFYGI
ncbi:MULTISPECIES: protein translocase subunit SecD [Acetobacterium]|jgi:preprotein translocase subunit SecD|uniref:Protein translocase subunit SecD n=1 Tax=Acetobacterium wieringae TaxID=52694 RepID=A0A1F2PIX8_9FIRM|nr:MULTISPECIES: protein translocase subunit SecD [Acetobacterium]MEA4806494.1 protein translocase subunit SecD [Acetobacterium wieringae]OFV70676.1 protein translocase subunit SecD [Acetobacterium wieringae]TYC88337.1 protein translocase subunit SecD [Acetobacterium wieringae]URN83046.1 protein translocase subunit SecD [Acetobacterium wieringae]